MVEAESGILKASPSHTCAPMNALPSSTQQTINVKKKLKNASNTLAMYAKWHSFHLFGYDS